MYQKPAADLITILGAENSGKTTALLAQALREHEEGSNVIFFSVRTGRQHLYRRLIAIGAGMEIRDGEAVRAPLSVQQRAETYLDEHKRRPNPFRVCPPEDCRTMMDIATWAIKAEADVIYIDDAHLLHLPTGRVGADGLFETLYELVTALKVPVIVSSPSMARNSVGLFSALVAEIEVDACTNNIYPHNYALHLLKKRRGSDNGTVTLDAKLTEPA